MTPAELRLPRDPPATLEDLGGWPAVLTELLDGRDLETADARAAMTAILSG